MTRYAHQFLILAILVVLAVTAAQAAPAGFSERAFTKTMVFNTKYLVYLPQGYETAAARKWPVLFFLHGSGERGEDLARLKGYGPLKMIEEGRSFPCIVVSPLCPDEEWWSSDNYAVILQELFEIIKREYRVDEDRVYVTGLSMGGFGTWKWAIAHPENFAAIAPICGGGDTEQVYRIRHVPVWAFHGAKDGTVAPEESQRMVEALRAAGGTAELTIYPECGHNSWDSAYVDERLYTWLFDQTRQPIEVPGLDRLEPMVCVKAPDDIVIDGDLSEWSKAPALVVESDDLSRLMRRVKLTHLQGEGGKSIYGGPQDCRADIRLMWSERGIFFAAAVDDDSLVCDRSGDPIWIGDCLDLGLALGGRNEARQPYILPADPNQGGDENFTSRDFIFGFAPSSPSGKSQYHIYRHPEQQNRDVGSQIVTAARKTGHGYTIEAFISAELLGDTGFLRSGSEIGCNCGIYDLDTKAEAYEFAISEYPSSGGNPWSPATFGRMRLE